MGTKGLAAVIAVLALGASACGAKSTSGGAQGAATRVSTAGTLSASGASVELARDARSTAKASTGRFSITEDITGLGSAGLHVTMTGAYDRANRLTEVDTDLGDLAAATGAAADLPPGDLKMTEVVDGTTVYLRSPLVTEELGSSTKPWFKLDVGSLLGSSLESKLGGSSTGLDPQVFLKYLQGASGGVVDKGHESIRGVDTHHYAAVLDLRKALTKVSAAERKLLRRSLTDLGSVGSVLTHVPADVWIGTDGQIHQMRLSMDTSGIAALAGSKAKASSVTVTITFFDLGQPVAISVPPAAQVQAFDLGSLGHLRAGGH